MPDRETTIQRVTTTEAGRTFPNLVKRVSKQRTRILVEENGTPVAAIVSARDLEKLSRMESERRQDFSVIEEARAAFQDVPPEEIEREVAKALAEVRQEIRDEEEGRQQNGRVLTQRCWMPTHSHPAPLQAAARSPQLSMRGQTIASRSSFRSFSLRKCPARCRSRISGGI